jgi:hypothetical protein
MSENKIFEIPEGVELKRTGVFCKPPVIVSTDPSRAQFVPVDTNQPSRTQDKKRTEPPL